MGGTYLRMVIAAMVRNVETSQAVVATVVGNLRPNR